jgi:putative copper resistance protein D
VSSLAEVGLIVTRWLELAPALILSGVTAFCLYGMDAARDPAGAFWARGWPRRLVLWAGAIACIGTLAWLVAESAAIAAGSGAAAQWQALRDILLGTRFGTAAVLRTVLLALVCAVAAFGRASRSLWWSLTLLGAAAVATFAWTGHGAMHEGAAGALHAAADVLHLWAAGLWIGALLALTVLLVRGRHAGGRHTSDGAAAARGLVRFSGLGPAVVAALILTGTVNSAFLIGWSRAGALLATAYGRVLAVKLGLFALMLACAAANRLWLTPQLLAAATPAAAARRLRALCGVVATETVLALLVIADVAWLGTLEPPA